MTTTPFRLAVFNQIFQKLIPSDEVKIAEKISGKGDIKSIQKNESLLRELNDFENAIETRPGERSNKRSAFSYKDLREELQEDFDSAIVKNLENFEGKFVLYQKQLREELSKFIRDENDRLLTAVKEGPHDRIKNEVSVSNGTSSHGSWLILYREAYPRDMEGDGEKIHNCWLYYANPADVELEA